MDGVVVVVSPVADAEFTRVPGGSGVVIRGVPGARQDEALRELARGRRRHGDYSNVQVVGQFAEHFDVLERRLVSQTFPMPADDVLAFAREAGHAFSLARDPLEPAAGVDVVFTDVWASMGQEEERAVRAAAFAGCQVNDRLMTLTNPGCRVQHCLPAHRGEEITAEVFEAHAQEIFDEAENRLHAQKAVMYLLMCPDAK